MDRIFIVKRIDGILLKSQLMLDKNDLVSSMKEVVIADCKSEMIEVFSKLIT